MNSIKKNIKVCIFIIFENYFFVLEIKKTYLFLIFFVLKNRRTLNTKFREYKPFSNKTKMILLCF